MYDFSYPGLLLNQSLVAISVGDRTMVQPSPSLLSSLSSFPFALALFCGSVAAAAFGFCCWFWSLFCNSVFSWLIGVDVFRVRFFLSQVYRVFPSRFVGACFFFVFRGGGRKFGPRNLTKKFLEPTPRRRVFSGIMYFVVVWERRQPQLCDDNNLWTESVRVLLLLPPMRWS